MSSNIIKSVSIKAITFITLILSRCACNGVKTNSPTPEPTPEPIPLTLDNYESYLEISGSYGGAGNPVRVEKHSGIWYPKMGLDIDIEGASPNFIYDNVEVTIKYHIQCTVCDDRYVFLTTKTEKFTNTLTVKCNVGGSGLASDSITILDYIQPAHQATRQAYVCDTDVSASISVVDIAGSVVRATN